MLIRRAELEGEIVDIRIAGGRIAKIGPHLPDEPDSLDAAGGALLPGLHDHHLHLLALAASLDSVRCGPPQVRDAASLRRTLARAPARNGWVRGTGYHGSVAGDLDRYALDALAPGRRVRVQHRSGALWILSSAAIGELHLDEGVDAQGIERDPCGRATGRLFALDSWLRERLPAEPPPDLSRVGRRLASHGVTGVTDATPGNGPDELHLLTTALLQHVLVMGGSGLPGPGARKILLRERDLPTPEDLERTIRDAHGAGRPVALHCVTRTELVLAASALGVAGVHAGDRIEHASVAPPELVALLSELPVTVVTQPGFLHERGDAYLREVEPRDRPWLYRCRGFLEAGIALGGSTDAPFGAPDPWLAIRTAVDRRSRAGAVLGADEALSPERALALFTTPPHAPGGRPRRLAPGAPADLCLLGCPWKHARDRLDAGDVVATLVAGAMLTPERDAA